MTYTNIASPYTTAGDPNANFNFNLGSWDRFQQGTSGFNKSQFKVALQQLQQAGVLDSSRGYANEKLKADVLRGTPGINSNQNPLGQYQGTGGNFGLKSYNAAKADGWSPQDIYDEIQRGRSGMIMPEGSMAAYEADIAKEQEDIQWRTDLETNLTDLNNQINQREKQGGVGYSAPSVVGKSGTRGANLKIAERGRGSGTKRWKRSSPSWSMATVNTGGTSGKASNSSAVNV